MIDRTITVSGGNGDYLWLDIQASVDPSTGMYPDLSTDTIQVAWTATTKLPSSWVTLVSPDVTQFPALGKARIGVFLGQGGHTINPGIYWAQSRVTDSPSIVPINHGQFQVF